MPQQAVNVCCNIIGIIQAGIICPASLMRACELAALPGYKAKSTNEGQVSGDETCYVAKV